MHSNTVDEPDGPGLVWNDEPSRDEVFGHIDAAIYTTDAHGWLTFYNDAAAELWGYRPELGRTRWCGCWRSYRPDGTPVPLDQCPMAVAMTEGREVRGVHAVLERPDGTLVPFVPFPTPLRDASGKLVAGSNMLLTLTAMASPPSTERVDAKAAIPPIDSAIISDRERPAAAGSGDGPACAVRPSNAGEGCRMTIRMHVRTILQTLSGRRGPVTDSGPSRS